MLKRLAAGVFAALLLILLVGYGTAFARVPACKRLFVQDLASHRVTVPPASSQVAARILLPFSVELSVSLPKDVRQAHYFATCIALPWRLDLSFRSELVPL